MYISDIQTSLCIVYWQHPGSLCNVHYGHTKGLYEWNHPDIIQIVNEVLYILYTACKRNNYIFLLLLVHFTLTHTWSLLHWHCYGPFHLDTYTLCMLLWHTWSILTWHVCIPFTLTHTLCMLPWYTWSVLSWHICCPFYPDMYVVPFTLTCMLSLLPWHKLGACYIEHTWSTLPTVTYT